MSEKRTARKNETLCKKTGKPCLLCMIGFIPDVLKCPNRTEKNDDGMEEDKHEG